MSDTNFSNVFGNAGEPQGKHFFLHTPSFFVLRFPKLSLNLNHGKVIKKNNFFMISSHFPLEIDFGGPNYFTSCVTVNIDALLIFFLRDIEIQYVTKINL